MVFHSFPEEAVQVYEQYQELSPRAQNDEFDGIVARLRELEDVDLEADDAVEQLLEWNRLVLQTRHLRMRFEAIASQLEDNPVWEEHKTDGEKSLRRPAPTFANKARELLVADSEAMTFPPDVDQAFALSHLPVDPEKLTPTMLRNLGLDDLNPPKGVHALRRMEAKAAAIPAVKEAVASRFEPIDLYGQEALAMDDSRYFRMMRAAEGPNEGMIVGTQENHGKKILFRTDLHGADRRVGHIIAGNIAETQMLSKLGVGLRFVHSQLAKWMTIRDVPEELDVLKEKLLEAIQAVNPRYVDNKYKKKMTDQVVHCVGLRDRLDRFNPGAIRARLVPAIRGITKRLDQLERITPPIVQDSQKLFGMVTAEESPLIDFADLVDRLHERFAVLGEQPLDPVEKVRILANLDRAIYHAEQLQYESYLSFGKEFITRIEQTKKWLNDDSAPESCPVPPQQLAAQEFTKAYLASKIARAYRGIKYFYRKISLEPETINPAEMQLEIDIIHKDLADRKVAGEVLTRGFNKVWGELYELCLDLKVEFDDLATKPIERPKKVSRHERKIQRLAARGDQERIVLRRALDRVGALDFPKYPKTSIQSLKDRKAAYKRMKKRINETSFNELAGMMTATEEAVLPEGTQVDPMYCQIPGEFTPFPQTQLFERPELVDLEEVTRERGLESKVVLVKPDEYFEIPEDVDYVGTMSEQGVLRIVPTSEVATKEFLRSFPLPLDGEWKNLTGVKGCKPQDESHPISSVDDSAYAEVTSRPIVLLKRSYK